MSVQDLQDALTRVAEMAEGYSDQLKKFKERNDEDLEDARSVLEGNRTGADDEVQGALGEASDSIDEAARAMSEAASAANDYAQNI
ncbi:hypothetical protein [Brevibacterium aurantiacum]|nr:hypothetical protein [Brevibacterium aurantiacum]